MQLSLNLLITLLILVLLNVLQFQVYMANFSMVYLFVYSHAATQASSL